MRTLSWAFLLVFLGPASAAAGQSVPATAVAAARAHYNAGRPAEALALLDPILTRPGEPSGAALVAARALLERFRTSGSVADLDAARGHLKALNPSALDADARRELIIGLAEALYLDDGFAAAAEMFETALGDISSASRERVLDWWATALDRHAQLRPQAERRLIYQRIAERMEQETRAHPGSMPAAYWLAAGARGMGDLDRAWSAAVAAWVRAPLTSDRGAALRSDIDRLVQQALIPERVRALGLGDAAAAGMQAEWDALKARWTR
ncbi:MAG: hypothetical protein M3R55_06520 [Acidobacteriota bacterium]|nr:hypothetical protein [Acidobacteriota bacterium]